MESTRPLLFAAAATVGTLLLGGLAPLLHALRTDPAKSLHAGSGREVEGGRRLTLLPAAGIGLAAVGLVTALALATSLMRLAGVDPGSRTENITALQFLRSAGHSHAENLPFLARVQEELRSIPGVRDVNVAVFPPSMTIPLAGGWPVQRPESQDSILTHLRIVSAGYHGFLGIPLRSGRDISERDVSNVPNVTALAVINETLARRAFGTTDPVGQVMVMYMGGTPAAFEVVGVAADVRNAGLRAPPEPEVAVSFEQFSALRFTLLVDGPPPTLPNWTQTLQEAVWRVDGNQPITRSYTLSQDLNVQTQDLRSFATLTGWFAVLALVLGAAGINAVVAEIQRRRTREIGLRMALGATPRRAASLVLCNAAKIVTLGLLTGALLGVPALAWLQDQLFGVGTEAFWGLFALAALVLATAGLATASWPAWRASRISPMEALRSDR